MRFVQLIPFFRRPMPRDAGLALVLAAASLLLGADLFLHSPINSKIINMFGSEPAWRQHVLWWWLAAAPTAIALLIRRRWPLPAFLLAAASASAHLLDPGLPRLPIDLAAVITLYTLASLARSRRVGAAALAVALVALYALCLTIALGIGQPGAARDKQTTLLASPWQSGLLAAALSAAAVPALLLGIAWAAGDNTRTRRQYLTTLERRAADLEREQDQRAALAVAAERARITRELHDVVAHGISVMVVQAQGAAAALQRHPDRTAVALTNVIDTGRTSLAEMRRLLDIARRDPRDGQQLTPQPGIGALPALIEQIRDTGTPVILNVEGAPVSLPAGVDLSAYRIVQEALTNTLKHAGTGASAIVRLAFQTTQLEIDVADDGRGSAAGGPTADGNGLRGIAERVEALGGSLRAGPRTGGGFAIHALLPIAATQ
jgi:signal transduction histidine kinase